MPDLINQLNKNWKRGREREIEQVRGGKKKMMHSVELSSTFNPVQNHRLCRFSRDVLTTSPPKRVIFVSSASSIKSDVKIRANAAPAAGISSASSTFSGWFSLQNNMMSSLAKFMVTKNSNQSSNQVDCEYQGEVEDLEVGTNFWPSLKKTFQMSPNATVFSELPTEAVVRISCSTVGPFVLRPWRKVQGHLIGSGFIVDGRRVLTCAHCVHHYTEVNLKKHNSDTFYTATVLVVALECDIAMLTVDADEFWEGVKPVVFGDMPRFGDELTTISHPNGEDDVYVTSCRSLGTDMLSYNHLGTKLLALKVNAQLERGCSGGPAFNEKGKCVGMIFRAPEGTVVIISTPVIMHFIQDYDRNGTYTGLPTLGILWQTMENPVLRMSMNMKSDQQGVLITEVRPNYPESEILMRNDVVLSIDGISIGNDGKVPFTRGQRIEFNYLLTGRYKCEEIVIKVLRNSEIHEFTIKLAANKQFKASITNESWPLSYYLVAEYVFMAYSITHLQDAYLETPEDFPDDMMFHALLEDCVVITAKLIVDGDDDDPPHDHDFCQTVNRKVLTLNGKPIQDLKTLVKMVDTCSEEFLQFVLEGQQVLVLQTNRARARTLHILKQQGIPSAMSDDLED